MTTAYAVRAVARRRPVVVAGLSRGRPAWHDYCSRKYRSFNPRTGYYTTYGGQQRFCLRGAAFRSSKTVLR
ncbi:BA14K family protein [Breoghania sp.]|uniref:BA14K family protein n=1 Tax=Breoghania sp. TaxID=2065378 RepID=UPI003204FB9E